MDAKEVLDGLIEKNTVFQNDQTSAARRKELKDDQNPAAVVLACSDSRVSPELIFNTEPGEFFVIRTAGNVLDRESIGSIESASMESTAKESAGIEKEGAGDETTFIDSIIEKIMPAMREARKKEAQQDVEESELYRRCIVENVKHVRLELLERSELVREAYEKGDLGIVETFYWLESGKVTFNSTPDGDMFDERADGTHVDW